MAIDKHIGVPDNDDFNPEPEYIHEQSVQRTQKSFWNRLWPVIACGAGLFSDGYLNNVSLI